LTLSEEEDAQYFNYIRSLEDYYSTIERPEEKAPKRETPFLERFLNPWT